MKQTMNEAQQRALARAFALREEGKTWPEVEKVLESEGFKDSKGKPYTLTNLRSWHSRLQGKAPGMERQPESLKADEFDTAKGRTPPDFLTREEVHKMRAELETQLIELIETKLGVEKLEPKFSLPLTTTEQPPLPPKEGKRFKGTKADIRVRVDENLGKLFEADVNQRFGGNASRCMDAILWNFYGKPGLSFEKPPDE
jgi:hypothetical protein